MAQEPRLKYTVHHKGRKYRAGSTASEIGPLAAEMRDHLWEGGKAPAKSHMPKDDAPDGGTLLGARTGVTASALPGNGDGSKVDPVVEQLGLGTADVPTGDVPNTTEDDVAGTAGPDEPPAGDTGTTPAPAKKATPAKKAAGRPAS